MNLFFFDLETTGLDINCAEILQIGGLLKQKEKKDIHIDSLFKPNKQVISIKARVVHGITDDKVKNKDIFGDKKDNKIYKFLKQRETKNIWVTHKGLDYDLPIINRYGIFPKHNIDTLKVARVVLEDEYDELEGSYALNNLKYYFLDKKQIKEKDINNLKAHDALSDVIVLNLVFKCLYNVTKDKFFNKSATSKEILIYMLDISNKPSLLARMPFGKYKSKKFIEIPSSTLNWYLTNVENISTDLKYTINYHLNNR